MLLIALVFHHSGFHAAKM